ncbi:AP-3 complex subunit beta [Scheffersomyces spartinae]|uniref:AP-3 complex subunit beta n=1 Tax=Scheffersomyces spartinae TaxID=45513 RepID=A0A9P8AIH7_9ASCO|nr:AP-3 complex subunit beta [Scheffersomyces spartinae]KAG7193141.1 AP-3 complex subunit beta [Scheffersomyces spartinae]
MTEPLGKLTSLLEAAKNMTIEAAATASSRLSDSTQKLSPQEISKCLNSRVETDILRGIRSVIYLMGKGEDVLEYFADVVKNITSSNVKIKNLVMVYVTKYAEVEPDTALLAINSIQKLLNEKDSVVRARSTRTLCGILILAIVPIMLLTIKRTVADPSPLVRSATAGAIESCYGLDDTNGKELVGYLTKLLADSEIQVVESAVKCYYSIRSQLKPLKQWLPIHGNFRRLCSVIGEFDEWTQCFVVEILVEYCRLFIARPKLYLDSNVIIDMPNDFSSLGSAAAAAVDYDVSYDDDYLLFIDSLGMLTFSSSDAVVLSVAKAYYCLTPPVHFIKSGLNKALLRIATNAQESFKISELVYGMILNISLMDKKVFGSYYTNFFLYPTDPLSIASMKLKILCALVEETNIRYILEELKYYSIKFPKPSVARKAIIAIGDCARISDIWNGNILKWCLSLLKLAKGSILSEILSLLSYLLQQILNSGDPNEDISKTCMILSQILIQTELLLEPKARVIWIIGEFTVQCQNKIGPDVLRNLIKNYAFESEVVRYQTLLLAAKIYCYEVSKASVPNETITMMFKHVLHCAKYDTSFDTRDRARVLSVLLDNTNTSSNSELACLFLQSPKPMLLKDHDDQDNMIKSSALNKYLVVTNWVDPKTLPSSTIRNEVGVLVNSYASKIASSDFRSSTSSPRTLTPPITSHSISSKAFQGNSNVEITAKKARDQLQSLDDFFGNDDSDSSELEGEEEDSKESEDDSEEEEDNDSEDDSEDDSEAGCEADVNGELYTDSDDAKAKLLP